MAGCGEASTPELCREACTLWDACEGPDDWYPFAVCEQECASEGDWNRAYVDCLGRFQSCLALEDNCG